MCGIALILVPPTSIDRVSATAFHLSPIQLSTVTRPFLSPSHMPLAALVIALGMPLTKSTMAVNFSLTPVQTSPALVTSQLQPSPMPSHTLLSIGQAVSMNHLTTASAAILMAFHAASTMARNRSEC
ncbi:Uncharacterised protein [Mycobacteroides abscessus subsp. abscessus]|nr:Uncharacterised protein [Mycobacteroides abscessus subsp. abscessus]